MLSIKVNVCIIVSDLLKSLVATLEPSLLLLLLVDGLLLATTAEDVLLVSLLLLLLLALYLCHLLSAVLLDVSSGSPDLDSIGQINLFYVFVECFSVSDIFAE